MIESTIKIPLYKCKIIVLIDTFFNINKENKKLCKKYRIEHEGGSDYSCVITTHDIHTYYILFSKNHLTLNRLVHEITHLGGTILDDRGHNTNGDSEPLAYLNGFLAEEVEKIMENNDLKLIHWKDLAN